MQWNIRHWLVSVIIVSVPLAVLRRPIAGLLHGSAPPVCTGFLHGFRHLVWLAGFEVEYWTPPASGPLPLGWLIGLGVGIIASLAFHAWIFYLAIELVQRLWAWAEGKPKEG
jgi:hypothetical protein